MNLAPPRRFPRPWRVICGLATVAGLMMAAGSASAAEPPNQNDPCSSVGRNTCGTTGVGSYERYRYGIRWFGDYRGAIDGIPPAFCIDLRFWYPAKRYNFTEIENVAGLRNKDGATVSNAKLARMAYVLWNHGRSNNANQQAAVMLYVHGLMGDGAPGEAAPDAIGPTVASIYRRISAEADRYRGPYRVETKLVGRLRVGTEARATVRVLSATGAPVPGVAVTLTSQGTSDIPGRVNTGSTGVATVDFTPDTAGDIRITAKTEALASTLPRIFRPTTPAAARNGQRLATAASTTVTATETGEVARTRAQVTTQARPARLLVGAATRDRITITGLPGGRRTPVKVELHGPFRTEADIACTAAPAATADIVVTRSGTYQSGVIRPTRPGIYTYRIIIEGDQNFAGVTTPCGIPAETIRVETQPAVRTQASAAQTPVGNPISDTVIVTGLNGETSSVNVSLYGPFGTREAVNCDGAPIWTGSVTATGDGEYVTDRFTPTVPGYYTYRERLEANGFVRGFEGKCGEVSEGVIVTGAPRITSQVSALQLKPGQSLSDRVIVTGMGALSTTINMELWGPYPTREAINCTGTPVWTGTIDAEIGDGVHNTERVRLTKVGYYTYRASIAANENNSGVATPCAEPSETALVAAEPTVTTIASADVVKPGEQIFDRVRVRGLGDSEATIELELFGPFASRAAIRCDVTPFWKGSFTVRGDGETRSPAVTIAKAGFYTYREKLIGTGLVKSTQGECGVVSETALGRPLVLTGRGDTAPTAARPLQAGRSAPTRVRVADLRIDAPVQAVGIDLANGALAVPVNIQRTGWFRDGAAPGDSTGSVLIAGHVDSARAGVGAFGPLKNATARTRIQVTSADGRTRTYRVTTVRVVEKSELPANIYSTRGSPRLVLVTCGGPFNASTGSYRDNVVVTAVPVRG